MLELLEQEDEEQDDAVAVVIVLVSPLHVLWLCRCVIFTMRNKSISATIELEFLFTIRFEDHPDMRAHFQDYGAMFDELGW